MNASEPKRYVYIDDVKLASALITLGFAPRKDNPIERVIDNQKPMKCFFYLEDQGGRISDFISAWQAKDDYYEGKSVPHELKNPDHPFWFLRTVLRNRERLIDATNNESRVIVFKTIRGKTYISTFNAYEFNRRENTGIR